MPPMKNKLSGGIGMPAVGWMTIATVAILSAGTPGVSADTSVPQDGGQDESEAPPSIPRSITSEEEGDLSKPRGLRLRKEGAAEGYTLYGPLNGKTIYLVDLDGEVRHRWATDSAPGQWSYLADDGSLWRCGREDQDPKFRGGGIGGRVQRLAPDGSVLWSMDFADDDRCQHHDIEPLPNGNLLVIQWERKSAEEAIAAGRDPNHVGAAGLWSDAVLEIEPTEPTGGKVVWEWHAWDHLVQDFDPDKANYGSVRDHPELIDINFDHRDSVPLTAEEIREQEQLEAQLRALGYIGGDEEEAEPEDADAETRRRSRLDRSGDWLHTNGVSYHPGLDLIALSTPECSELWVIDHSTSSQEATGSRGGGRQRGGDLLWRWGNPKVYGAGSEEDRKLFYQHEPTWLGGTDGDPLRLLCFNNGGDGSRPGFSSVDELVLPFDPEKGFLREGMDPFGPREPAWNYRDPEGFFSAFISGAQRLPNGNTLICSGVPGRIFEVTHGGEIVWDYRSPHGGEIDPPEHAGNAPAHSLFRAMRYAPSHPGIRALGL